METKVKFQPISSRLFISDFQRIVALADTLVSGKETILFKHHKSLNELAYQMEDFYEKGTLMVYEDVNEPNVPVGILSCGVTELWWIEGKVLLEEFVLSLTKRDCGFGRFAIDTMETLAKINGCVLILSGSSMVEKTKEVENMYRKKGFVVYGESFLKELN